MCNIACVTRQGRRASTMALHTCPVTQRPAIRELEAQGDINIVGKGSGGAVRCDAGSWWWKARLTPRHIDITKRLAVNGVQRAILSLTAILPSHPSLYWPLGVPMPPLPASVPHSDPVAPDALRAVPLLLRPVTFRSFPAQAVHWLPR